MSQPVNTIADVSFAANGREYHPPPRPVVVICIDGCADEYLNAAIARGRMPNTVRMIRQGYRGLCRATLPSYTNINNACIVTGSPPAVTGIVGNYFLDPQTGQEVMMNSPKHLRCETILAAAARAGRKVAIVTAKDKLCEILSAGLNGIAFSAEKANEATDATHGIGNVETLVGQATPDIYSAQASLFVLRAGVALIEHDKADFLCLSLTDYIQHKYAPEAPEAIEFHAAIDRQIGRLLELDTLVGITADHGMNAKMTSDGKPNIIWLETLLSQQFGQGFRVVLPITDPYVLHHASLGSFAVIYLPSPSLSSETAQWLIALDGISEVYDRQTAATELQLPEDRIGDLVVLADRNVAIGRTPQHHDLSALDGVLRSHGGRYEETVPMLISQPPSNAAVAQAAGDPRNFDIFAFTCGGSHT